MDWIDIGLHALGALAFTWFFTAHWPKLWGSFAVGNAVFWLTREILQHDHFPTSLQSNLEWIVPSVLGLFTAAWVSAIFGEHEKCSCDLHTLGDDD